MSSLHIFGAVCLELEFILSDWIQHKLLDAVDKKEKFPSIHSHALVRNQILSHVGVLDHKITATLVRCVRMLPHHNIQDAFDPGLVGFQELSLVEAARCVTELDSQRFTSWVLLQDE